MSVSLHSAGDAALLVVLGDSLDREVNERVHALAARLQGRPGLRESVPAYASLLVHYDPEQIGETAVRELVREQAKQLDLNAVTEHRHLVIPVRYDGPDLEFVAAHSGLSREAVIELHSAVEYRVYMLGFTPGFAYLGDVDERIAMPRLTTPRLKVPAGSVGIAGRQTGIYPSESPGGWRLLGHTPLRLFDLRRPDPFLLAPGDRVRFEPLSDQH
ncbi:MAG: 5-oxoprolinase subunit PxpB [Anaerolineales bacterium]|nr:5-oxoprolinase subunit PxpB [Anaerolineales bacterium]